MRKLLFIAWVMVCAVTLAMTSCRDKKTQDKVNNRVENVKKSTDREIDRASDKLEAGTNKIKKAWKETKEDVKEGAQKVKKEVKEGYNNVKDEVKKKLDEPVSLHVYAMEYGYFCCV